LSPTLSFASRPSLRHHPTSHWPHRWTEKPSSKCFCSLTLPCGSRNYQSPVSRCPSTAIPLPGDLGRSFQHPHEPECFGPSMICRPQAPKQRRSWSHSVLCGQACKAIAAPVHVLASSASTPKSPATQSLH
jgi:hypothetical protein